MPRPSLLRILIATFLLLALAAPFARAEEPETRGDASLFSLADLLDRAWGELMSLWPANGCIIDPSGGCMAGQKLDNGCIADPSGGCRPGS